MNISPKRRKATTSMTRVRAPLVSQKVVLEPRKYLEAVLKSYVKHSHERACDICRHCQGDNGHRYYRLGIEDINHKKDCIVIEAEVLLKLLNDSTGETT